MDHPMPVAVRLVRNAGIVALLLAVFPPGAGAQDATQKKKFDPPRIIAVVRAPDAGGPGSASEASYYMNRGQESNMNRGDVLNVYREVRLDASVPRPLRIFIGTMTITEAQVGSSLGSFMPGPNISQPIIKYKAPVKGDLVVPRLIIDSSVLFDAGKADLKAGARQEFDKVANFVQNFSPSKLIIEGHTDSDGDDAANQLLSEGRANAVRQFIILTYPFITAGMIEARGFGERQPIAVNDIPENKALNRRIEVVVWE